MALMRIGLQVLLTLMAMLAAAPSHAEPLTFGVLNQQSPSLTAERWNPILGYLSRQTGTSLRLRMGPTVEKTNAMMAAGEFDLAFTNHNFKPEYDALGFRVIARWGSEASRAAIAVAADSPFRKLEELAGKRVAFPSPHAFLGHAVPSVALKQTGITVENVFAGNQEGALAQLKARRVDAAAINARFGEQYAAREHFELRTIYVSEPFPDLAVIVHPRVAADVVEALRRALVGMAKDAEGAEILAKANCPGFALAEDTDYARVRAVYLEAEQ
jgi:phosphonate transport system substrate-binding protein